MLDSLVRVSRRVRWVTDTNATNLKRFVYDANYTPAQELGHARMSQNTTPMVTSAQSQASAARSSITATWSTPFRWSLTEVSPQRLGFLPEQ